MSASRSLSFPAARRLDISARKILVALAFAALAVYCAAGAYLVIAGSARMVPSPNENTYPESLMIYTAVQGARTGHVYLPLYSPPYALQQYGPLFYLLNFGVARASHLDLDLVTLRLRWLLFFLASRSHFSSRDRWPGVRTLGIRSGQKLSRQSYSARTHRGHRDE